MTAGKLRALTLQADAPSPVTMFLQTPDGPKEISCESYSVAWIEDAGVKRPELVLVFTLGKMVAKSV